MADSKFSDVRALGPTWRQSRDDREYDDATDLMVKLLKQATAAKATTEAALARATAAEATTEAALARATAAEARAEAALARAIAAEAALEQMQNLDQLNELDHMLYNGK